MKKSIVLLAIGAVALWVVVSLHTFCGYTTLFLDLPGNHTLIVSSIGVWGSAHNSYVDMQDTTSAHIMLMIGDSFCPRL